jgi:membrane fusion protein (multidrug efflux system)
MIVPTQTEEALKSNHEATNDETTNRTAGKDSHPVAVPPVANTGRRSRVVGIVLLLAVLAGAGVGAKQLWGYFDSYESTDDAQIEGHLNGISSRISGTVTAVHFENNQKIAAGEVLVELDPRDYRVSLEQATASMGLAASQLTAERPNVPIVQTSNESVVATSEANIAQAEAAVAQAERDYDSTIADLRQAEANNTRAQTDEARYRGLVEKEEISRTLYDQKLADAKAGEAAVEAKRATSEAARRIIAQRQASLLAARTQMSEAIQNNPRQLLLREATVQMRQANIAVFKSQVDQAKLNLSYTRIVAPVAGIAGKKSVEVGEQVRPGQQLLAISQTDEVWVTANFKETQLKRMHPGQPVSVGVDALDRKFDGLIESMPGATGAVYSVLPPENATGNYVKVVQRLPVRIRLKRDQAGLDLLHPGMSVEPVVHVRQPLVRVSKVDR